MSHWYIIGPNGFPTRYYQYNKDGSLRKYIVRKKAYEDGAVESVTTLLQRVSDQSFLIEWAAQLGVKAGVETALDAAISNKTPPPMNALIDAALAKCDEERNRGANIGTIVHDAIEQYLTSGAMPDESRPVERIACASVRRFLETNSIPIGMSEHCLYFSGEYKGEPLAYGGTTDYIAHEWILDFKTTKPDAKGKFWTRKPEHCAQLAAYRHAASKSGLCKPTAKCVNLYIDSATGRIVDAAHWSEEALRKGMDVVAFAYRITRLIYDIEQEAKA